MNYEEFLVDASEQVAARMERVTATSMLATAEAATVAGSDLALWLYRRTSRLTGGVLLEVCRHVPPPPWTPVRSSADPLSHAARVTTWSAVVATPVLARRVLLQDIREALDLSTGVRLSAESQAVLERNQERLVERSLPQAGVDPALDMPASLKAITVRSSYLQNELSRDSFERTVRHFASVDGYGTAFDGAKADLRDAIERRLTALEPATTANVDLAEHRTRLRDIAEMLRISVRDSGESKGIPSEAFARAVFRVFESKVRSARRLNPSKAQV